MKRAEELARGLFNCLSKDRYLTEDEHRRIVEAITTYGQEVRKRDAEICRGVYPHHKGLSAIYNFGKDASEKCAAAIEREGLP